MKKRVFSVSLALVLLVQLLPTAAFAAFPGKDPGDELFTGPSNTRVLVSETERQLAPGVTEFVTHTNDKAGRDQNIDYFCEIDLSKAKLMACYPGMEKILTTDKADWRMQGVSGQVSDTQRYFDNTPAYQDHKIVAAVNGDWYNMATGQPRGLTIIEGKKINDWRALPVDGYEGYYFAITKEGKPIISINNDPAFLATLDQAIGGSMLLLKDGQRVHGGLQDTMNVTWSAIGIKADGTVVTLGCHGQSYPVSCGYTESEVAMLMQARGCVDAMMLDGSGSSTYVSRHPGETGVAIRNSPSDGQERMVSSSLLIISTAEADGVFHRAEVEPDNEVYTPTSSVQFTAAGVDKSGAPAPLPAGAYWTLSDGSFGTIDNSSGLFTSNGKCGEVQANLNAGSKVVGSASILIQGPDQLTFSAEAVNVGFGETSNLGLQVRYQNRDVHYKDGDFDWTLSDSGLGSMKGNLFIAHPSNTLSGTITVTSRWSNAVRGTVTVNVGTAPQIAMDFEDDGWNIVNGTTKDGQGDVQGVFENGTYYGHLRQDCTDSISAEAQAKIDAAQAGADAYCLSYTGRNGSNQVQVGKASISDINDGPVHSGSKALKLDYDFTGNAGATDGVCFGLSDAIALPGTPNKIGLWVYIPEGTPSLWLRMRYLDGAGRFSQIDFTKEVKAGQDDPNGLHHHADNAWHYYEASLENLITPVTIPAGMSIRLMVLNPGTSPCGWTLADGTRIDQSENYGTLYFDDLTFIYGSNNADTVLPEVSSVTVNGAPLKNGAVFSENPLAFEARFSDSIEDNPFNSGINGQNVRLYVDGQQIEDALVDVAAGSIRHDNLILGQGTHTLRLLVTDQAGNQAIRSYNITVTDPSAPKSPVALSIRENAAVLGGNVTLDFTPQVSGVTGMDVTVTVPKAYRSAFTLTPAAGCTVAREAKYDAVTGTVSFAVSGGGTAGTPMATLTFPVPASVASGTQFSTRVTAGQVTGLSGDTLPYFGSETISLGVTAPYTVSAGTMVRGLTDSLFFTISDSGTKQPVPGVTLYRTGGTVIGTSDAQGRVSFTPGDTERSVTVYAQDTAGGVSGSCTAAIYEPQGKADGTPTHVWRNAAHAASSASISWMANPVHSGGQAVLQLADSAEGIAGGKTYTGTSSVSGFNSDGAAARINGVKLEDLSPGTTYYYRVGDGAEGHWSDVSSFTAGYPNTGTNMLILGDLQESDNTTLSGILQQPNTKNCDLTIQTGDFVDAGGSYHYWDQTFAMLSGLTNDRLFSLGNHETEGGLDINALMYNQNSDYYSVEYGNVYIASIAYNGGSAGYPAALEWLKQDAAKSTATWKILVSHQPPYYTNTAGGNETAHQLFPAAVQAAGIDAVLSGHDHSYARTEPLYNGAVDKEKGVTYFICGSLGEKSYAVTKNPAFHFAQVTDAFQSVYLTLSTTSDTLEITAYDYRDGKVEQLDHYTKTKGGGAHTHDFLWTNSSRMTCACGYSVSTASYTGYASYKDGQVYLHQGKVQTGVFAVGEEVLHAGEDGLLHKTQTVSTATCTKDGELGCWCHSCNLFVKLSEKRYTGHEWDENHVCTDQIFDMNTFQYKTCGYHGRDISKLPVQLSYTYGYYTGEERRPAVAVTDRINGQNYRLLCQSTYGDCVPYYSDNVDVGRASIRIEGYGNYYGEQTVTFDIIPANLEKISAENITTNSVTLTWDAAKGAEEYIVYENRNGTWTRLGIVKQTRYTVTGLNAGEHQFRIRPFKQVKGENFYSAKNSEILTVNIEGEGIRFEKGGTVNAVYGDAPFTNAASLAGSSGAFQYSSSDDAVASVDPATGEVTIHAAGSAVITAQSGEKHGQYRLSVAPKAVGLSWSGQAERVYDGTRSNVTAEATGLLEGDSAEVTVSGGDSKDAGTYTAAASAISNSNYALPDENSVSYTITPAVITLKWSGEKLTYSGQEQAPTPSAANGLIEGDTVEFAIQPAVDPGTYFVTAVGKNPNYIVADDSSRSCKFEIVLPTVSALEENIVCSIENTTIYVSGIISAGDNITITAFSATGISTSTTVGKEENSKLPIGDTFYTVDVSGLAVLPQNMSIKEESKNVTHLAASVAGSVEKIVNEVPGINNETSVEMTVSLKIEPKNTSQDEENATYTVDIKPVYTIKAGDEEIVANQDLPNEYLKVPVLVSLTVPDKIKLDEDSTFVQHKHSGGKTEYIKPQDISGNALTFWAHSFSEYTVCSDTRKGQITFPLGEDGTTQTRVYDPSSLGVQLPSAGEGCDGWLIDGTVYKALTDELLSKLSQSEDQHLTAEPNVVKKPISPGGPGGGSAGSADFAVSTNAVEHGKITVEPKAAAAGETVQITLTPDAGYTAAGVTVTDKDGKVVPLTKKSDTLYTFTMPAGKVTVTAVFRESETSAPIFTDVAQGAYYYDAVLWAVEEGITTGTSSTRFSPDLSCTRGQMVTFLWRAAGSPAASTANGFQDISSEAYYYDAVLWAVEKGITNGTSASTFSPDATVTRSQTVTFLYRYAGEPEVTVKAPFTDVASDAFYADAVQWAAAEKISNCTSETQFSPNSSCTRGQIVTFLYRQMAEQA